MRHQLVTLGNSTRRTVRRIYDTQPRLIQRVCDYYMAGGRLRRSFVEWGLIVTVGCYFYSAFSLTEYGGMPAPAASVHALLPTLWMILIVGVFWTVGVGVKRLSIAGMNKCRALARKQND